MNDKYIIPLFVAGSLLLALFAFFLIAYLLVQKRKQNKYQLEKQQMIFDHEKNLLRTKIEEQENSMNHISMEIHDNVKSVLVSAQMRIYKIAELATNTEQAAMIDEANKKIKEVIDELYDISHSLNSKLINRAGLVETITTALEHIQFSKNIVCNIDIIGNEFPLNEERELQISRIAQEAIQNCIKHAQATNINFTLNYEPHLFTMKISDNGIGFDMNKINGMKGLGFLNMFQRARYVHGLLEVESAPNEGSNITLTLKMDNDGANN